ncbi:MAG: hypothetical protein GF383_02880 [Candidatus Lokiarchaeota archaeon]|nr:hypothetical protein [Candidatus Lokiarchaeota archaeon]MBD3338459.1 hypothetical protein [Candidatus Lokiarchaeota archaeon]
MRNNKKVFVKTNDLNFFYRLNEKLSQVKIKYKILEFKKSLPALPSLILTTAEEAKTMDTPNKDYIQIVSYKKGEDFEKFFFKVLAAYRIGHRKYREMIVSIDPGTKHIGLVIFLDDFYLISHTFHKKRKLIKKIKSYREYLQEDDEDKFFIQFKIGIGVLWTALELVEYFFKNLPQVGNMKFSLIDESKSSKIKLRYNDKRLPKHETSALVIAFRNGIEVTRKNYLKVFHQLKSKQITRRELIKESKICNSGTFNYKLKKIAKKILDGDLSLSESYDIINENKQFY